MFKIGDRVRRVRKNEWFFNACQKNDVDPDSVFIVCDYISGIDAIMLLEFDKEYQFDPHHFVLARPSEPEPVITEVSVVLPTQNGDVVTTYPIVMLADAQKLFSAYVRDGKKPIMKTN